MAIYIVDHFFLFENALLDFLDEILLWFSSYLTDCSFLVSCWFLLISPHLLILVWLRPHSLNIFFHILNPLVISSSLMALTTSQFCSVQSTAQSCPALRLHGLQHTRPPCPSPTPRVYSNSCPLSWWCHPTISSSVVPFSSRLQSFLASGSFPVSQFFASGGQSIGVSVSTPVLPMNIQDWFPLELTGWISLQSKGLSSLFQHHSSKASILRHSAFFTVQLWHPYMTYWKNHSLD